MKFLRAFIFLFVFPLAGFAATTVPVVITSPHGAVGATGVTGATAYSCATVIDSNGTSSLTSTAWTNYMQLTLTPGTWICDGQMWVSSGTGAITVCHMAISQYSGATTTDQLAGSNHMPVFPPTTTYPDSAMTIAGWNITVAVSTTIYLKYNISFTGSSPTLYGRLTAIMGRPTP